MDNKEKFQEKLKPYRIDNGFCGIGIGEGWHDIVLDLHDKLVSLCPSYSIIQIKEKFGGLRYYYAWTSDISEENREAMHDAVRAAEKESYHTCEECGMPGVLRKGRWILTLCDEHAKGAEPYDTEDAFV